MDPVSERLGPILGRRERAELHRLRRETQRGAYGPDIKARVIELVELGATPEQILARTPFKTKRLLRQFCGRHGIPYTRPAKRHDWTDDQLEEVRRLLSVQIGPAQIALRLGVSKNAVVGKIWRYRLRDLAKRPERFTIQRRKPYVRQYG